MMFLSDRLFCTASLLLGLAGFSLCRVSGGVPFPVRILLVEIQDSGTRIDFGVGRKLLSVFSFQPG